MTVAGSFPLWYRQARSHPDLATVALNPGIIDTEMLQSTLGASSADFPAPAAWAEKAVPLSRKTRPPRQRQGAHDAAELDFQAAA